MKSEINDPKAIAENDIYFFQDKVVEKALEVCDILKYEFIFCKPCQDLENVIIDTLGNLNSTGIISLKEEAYLDEELWSRRYAKTFDDSSDEEYSNTYRTSKIQYKVRLLRNLFSIKIHTHTHIYIYIYIYIFLFLDETLIFIFQLSLTPEDSRHMEFLHTLLRPLIDTYTFSAFTLRKMVGRSLSERDMVHEILSEIKTNIDRGTANYGMLDKSLDCIIPY